MISWLLKNPSLGTSPTQQPLPTPTHFNLIENAMRNNKCLNLIIAVSLIPHHHTPKPKPKPQPHPPHLKKKGNDEEITYIKI